MKIFSLMLALVCCGAAFFNVKAQTKETDEVIKIDTNLISVPVVVNDRQGRFIPNLRQSDFTIFQDGEPQEISFFAPVEEPISVALLLDTSKSTRGVLGEIQDAADDFVKLLKPADRAMIVTFDYQVNTLSALTSDRRALERAIGQVDIGEYAGTVMRDAVETVVNKSFAGVKGRKAIILLTDGKDHGSSPTQTELLNRLEESDVMVYSVFYDTAARRIFQRDDNFGRRAGIFDDDFPRPRQQERRLARQRRANENAADYLSQMSELTAGRFYEDENIDLQKTFALIADELKKQYRIGYYPKEETVTNDAVHQIKVKVSRPDVAVRARATYRFK